VLFNSPRMRLAVFLGTLALIGLVMLFAPVEKDLGANARLVYFHGAWVWSGLGCFFLSGTVGLGALLTRRQAVHTWSKILGWTAMVFWLTYLPVSLLVMKLNWGGLFLDEPRWRVPLAFGIVGVLLQAGMALLNQPALTSLANAGFAAALLISLSSLTNILHPDAPILTASSHDIQLFFIALLALSIAAGIQIAALIARRINGS
jgi:uncharacterized membrane protein YfcA